ncbi:hypothetical protein DB30_02094 [Enhygromyxa salina]|uniref:Uncharacterized protein n=1 Tax=Enhygromyxa salina TaxID=215803 RepID=A0A0C1Z362_9BACT|nr:DUF3093 family protein [Enhygromyxa salina]KIG12039.1 hypothetical protein DB30_02094 [Enhygromyxa salina]
MSEGHELVVREDSDSDSESASLAVNGQGRSPDAYEAKYMHGEGMVLYRDKSRAPWPLHAVFAAISAVTIGSAFAGPGAWVGAAITLPLVALMWLLFSILRVTVSQGQVNVQYGLFGPKIPIASISSAEAVEYDWKQWGGWGIRVNTKGEWIYNMPGDRGRAVRIAWQDRKGKSKVTYVGSLESEDLARRIAEARALAGGTQPAALEPGDD